MQEDVDVDEDTHRDPCASGHMRERLDRSWVVCRNRDCRMTRKLDDARELRRIDDLVGDQHVADAGRDHHLGLPHRGAGHAGRRPTQLTLRKLRCSMSLHVRSDGLASSTHQRRHGGDIGVEDVEIDHECGRRERRDHGLISRAPRRLRTAPYLAPHSASGSKRRDTATSFPTAEDTEG